MAKRFIDTDLFKKPFMRSLEAPYKALWVYLLCECDHAGIWSVELDVAQLRMGMKLDPEKALEKMGGAVVSIDGGAKWYLPDFIAFQYGTLNPANRVHESVLSLLSKHGIDPNEEQEKKGLTSPLKGAKDKEKDKDSDKDLDTDKEERAHEPEVEPTFKQWFDLYDKRKALGECQAKWRTIDQGTREAIMSHTARLVATTPKEYRKDPIRYLMKRGWEDEIIQRTSTTTATSPKHMTDEEYVRESARVAYEAHQRRTAAAAQG